MKRFCLLTGVLSFLVLPACETVNQVKNDVSEGMETLSISSFSKDNAASENFLLNANCPSMEILPELSSLSEFTGTEQKIPALLSTVAMTNLDHTCSYQNKMLVVDVNIKFEGALGAEALDKMGKDPLFSYPYFVAVLEPNGEILAKEVFSAGLTYDKGETIKIYHEDLRQVIPVHSEEDGSRHRILIGFQLTRDQLDYNRAQIARYEAMKAAEEAQKKAEMEAQKEANKDSVGLSEDVYEKEIIDLKQEQQ